MSFPAKKLVTAYSTKENIDAAIEEVVEKLLRSLDHFPCDLLLLFISEPKESLDTKIIPDAIKRKVSAKHVLACNTSGIVTEGKEYEMCFGISAMAFYLPEVKIQPFSISPKNFSKIKKPEDFLKRLDIYPTDKPLFLCLADARTCDLPKLLRFLDEDYPEASLIGGLSSAEVAKKRPWFQMDDEIYEDGFVSVCLSGNIESRQYLAQGCRPVSEPLIITEAEENILLEIAGRSAVDVLYEILQKLPAKDQKMAQEALFLGIAIRESASGVKGEDFIIRNLMGIDQERQALVVGEYVRVGEMVQFHLLDKAVGDTQMKKLVSLAVQENKERKPFGGILVNCCGRGRRYFMKNHGDASQVKKSLADLSFSGFFANGEFGTFSSRHLVHGYSSCLSLFF